MTMQDEKKPATTVTLEQMFALSRIAQPKCQTRLTNELHLFGHNNNYRDRTFDKKTPPSETYAIGAVYVIATGG